MGKLFKRFKRLKPEDKRMLREILFAERRAIKPSMASIGYLPNSHRSMTRRLPG
jgi:hypothetical protein